jgi:hypothetical protein
VSCFPVQVEHDVIHVVLPNEETGRSTDPITSALP